MLDRPATDVAAGRAPAGVRRDVRMETNHRPRERMETWMHAIQKGDLERVGMASRALKARLQKLGVAAEIIRRIVIAAYEAESNVSIHARRGQMRVRFHPKMIEVMVTDEGPGIVDVSQAFEEGFSTAPEHAQALGFGAGMGLPNIRKHTDRFTIDSEPGCGTELHFTIYLQSEAAVPSHGSSIVVDGTLCKMCLRCLPDCPTAALRIRDGRPLLLDHRCIDCGTCLRSCGTGALTMMQSSVTSEPSTGAVLLIPAALLTQFGTAVDTVSVMSALRRQGFTDVRVIEDWQRALRLGVAEYARGRERQAPVIVPSCPAILNLIEARFPALLADVAPLLTPIIAACHELHGRDLVVTPACPSQLGALECAGLPADPGIADLTRLKDTVLSHAGETKASPCPACSARTREMPPVEDVEPESGWLVVTSLSHCVNVLEQLERRALPDVRVVELYACPERCFGSPLMSEEPFIARQRWSEVAGALTRPARSISRIHEHRPRPGLRLDASMSVAMQKLAAIDRIVRTLPGRDCAACGTPTCEALAEDIVCGRATEGMCLHMGTSHEE